MSDKRQCVGVILNPKDPRQGNRCSRWAKQGSEYCGAHQGEGGTGVPYDQQNLKAPRCTARPKGVQCKRPAGRGMTVCRHHGGAARQTLDKAQREMARLRGLAMWEAETQLVSSDASRSERMAAAKLILQYAMPKEIKIDVEHQPWQVTFQHISKSASDDVLAEAEAEAKRYRAKAIEELVANSHRYDPDDPLRDSDHEDIEEAEIVEEDPRDYLPQIKPAYDGQDREYVPPRKPTPTGSSDPRWLNRRRNEDD